MGGGFGYTNQRKMKETKSSHSMGESMNLITLKSHCERASVVRVAGTEYNFGREFFSCPFPKDHKYNCNFFVWVDEAEALGLLNGILDQDVWKVGLLRKNDNLKKRNACNDCQNGGDDIWKAPLMEKMQILSQDRNNEKVWKTKLLDRIDALMNEVKLLKYMIVLLCILEGTFSH
ncbi:GRF zinc finger protein [Medicago truncatula]|uniref:GRF zinc finger protein n=1 Tax=Medicago truncatula TaxID=3880 RepID=G7LHQ1_MEDTR|nr:GRF zinc finger protein [Medicago truncatula]